MELKRNEVESVKKIADEVDSIVELRDVALALVGGGCGEVIFPH